jgi:hypothetical protein
MTVLRRWLRALSTIELSLRQSAVFASVTFALLMVLSLLWLSMTTRTAVLNAEIDKLDARRLELEDASNQRWRQLGQLSNPVMMSERAEKLGFTTVSVEYLVIEGGGIGESTTLTVTASTQ